MSSIKSFVTSLLLTIGAIGWPLLADASPVKCTAEDAWLHIREMQPLHMQEMFMCVDGSRRILIVSEPPAHVVRSKAESIVRALFTSQVVAVTRHRHKLGFDGWVEDLAVELKVEGAAAERTLSNDLALLAGYLYGSTYKAEVHDLARLEEVPLWQAPPSLDVRAEELHAWFFGPSAQTLAPLAGGPPATLKSLADSGPPGVYASTAPGLVVALLPRRSQPLNDLADVLRHFAVDTDAFIGAIELGDDRLALVGRQRTTSRLVMPPLRVDTILLLASTKEAHLSQSYERTRVFAGKLLKGSGSLIGEDWAPILLSERLVDTEYGSLLNFTDNMVKGWSLAGKVTYRGFPHEDPDQFPFGDKPVTEHLSAETLTFNWNTAGAGYVVAIDQRRYFSVRHTGSLPVSYFPGGTRQDDAAREKLRKTEDQAYAYFRSLRSPLLARAAQYAALYQAFQAFPVNAKMPHADSSPVGHFGRIERILVEECLAALTAITTQPVLAATGLDPDSKVDLPDAVLSIIYTRSHGALDPENIFVRELNPNLFARLAEDRAKLRDLVSRADKRFGPDWRKRAAESFAEDSGLALPPNAPAEATALLEEINGLKSRLLFFRSREEVRARIVRETDRQPAGWIRTPSIVVSDHDDSAVTGGHNIGGKATRIVPDSSVPKGTVEVTGSYEHGRTLKLHPDDAARGRELVREFDRVAGIDDANMAAAKQSIERSLRVAAPPPAPPRPVVSALRHDLPPALRGVPPTQHSMQIGVRRSADTPALQKIIADAESRSLDILIKREADGRFIVFRRAPKPSDAMIAVNEASMIEALDVNAARVAGGPPPLVGRDVRIGFENISPAEVANVNRSLALRQQTALGGGNGGEPPFGANRFTSGAPKDPRRPYSTGGGDRGPPQPPEPPTFFQRMGKLFGIKRETIAVKFNGPEAEVVAKAKANWKEAKIRPAEFTDVVELGRPSAPAPHIIDVEVPVLTQPSPPRTSMQLIAWFERELAAGRRVEADQMVKELLEASGNEDLRRTFERYKGMMVERFGATDIEIRIQRQLGDLTVTERVVFRASNG